VLRLVRLLHESQQVAAVRRVEDERSSIIAPAGGGRERQRDEKCASDRHDLSGANASSRLPGSSVTGIDIAAKILRKFCACECNRDEVPDARLRLLDEELIVWTATDSGRPADRAIPGTGGVSMNSRISSVRSRAFSILAAVLLVSCGTLGATPAAGKMTPASFQDDMRKLWEDHITYTRLYIVSAAGNPPDKDATAQRLLQNQADIGNAIKPIYGDDAGNKLTALLRDHILIAAKLIDAAKANNSSEVETQKTAWDANADQISALLSGANPKNWPLETLKSEMRSHLNLTLEEAVAQLKGNYAASIAAYDKVHQQILHMADMLSSGIVRQFPTKFAA
jgi:hypothetical protein